MDVENLKVDPISTPIHAKTVDEDDCMLTTACGSSSIVETSLNNSELGIWGLRFFSGSRDIAY